MKNRLTPALKPLLAMLFLFILGTCSYAQVNVQFRVRTVTSDVGDMDPADNSDPTWTFQITDVPFANTSGSSYTAAETNCPGSITINNLFFSQIYNCELPTSYDFVWSSYEDDGTPGTSDAYTGNQLVSIPAASIAYPNGAWTTLGTYNATAAGLNCAAGATVTSTIQLQYRTIGASLDIVNPTVTCPANVTQVNDAGNCSAVVNGIAPASVGDNCAVTVQTWALTGATVASSPATGINDASGQTFNVGVTTVTYTVQDAAGNSATCSFTVTITDTENPTITCPGNVNTTVDAGNCSAVVNGIAPVATNDNCGVTIQTWALTGATTANSAATGINDASGQTFNVGATTVTYTLTDAANNTITCSFTVTVSDDEDPTITCPANVSQVNDAGNCSAVVNGIAPVATNDNCGVTVQTWTLSGATVANSAATGINDASGQTFNVGVTTVTYFVEDAASNSATCSFTVTVTDAEAPTITCPANVTQVNDAGNCSAVVTGIAPTATNDNCGVTIQTWALTGATTANSAATGINDASGQTFNVGVTTVTYTLTDAASNTITCSFTVTITDTENPTITCPGNVNTTVDAGNCSAVVNGIAPVATNDNCGVTIQTWALTGATTANSAATGINDASGQTFNVGATTVTYTLTDAANNTITCSFTVTVSDDEDPTITCPANVSQVNDAGNCSAVVTGIAPVATNDNCGVTVQTWTLSGATVANSAATGINDASGQTFNVGVTTVTYFVEDAASNSATCSFTVTVTDAEAPTITCPANVIQVNDAGNCSAVVTGIAPTATNDNCGVTIQTWALTGATTANSAATGINDASGQTFNVGVTTVTYTLTDAASNTIACSFAVTITDTENPTITCPANVTQVNDAGNCSAVVNGIAPTATNDNCAITDQTWTLTGATTASSAATGINDASGQTFNVGVTTVTYLVTDAATNSATCSFTVTITDTENPTITCPGNVNTTVDAGNCSAVVNGIAPVATNDNCGVTIQTWALTGATTANSAATGINDASGQTFNVGVTTVTYTLTDAANNTITCSFTVTVSDDEDPTITCPANVSQVNDAGNCSAVVNGIAPVATNDNCGVTVQTWTLSGATVANSAATGINDASGQTFNVGVTTVTYFVEDAASNSATCSFTVTVTDAEAPTITCPANVTQVNDAGNCSAVVTGIAPTATNDNCGVTIQTWALTGATTANSAATGINDASGQTFNVGVTTVTYTLTDAASNTITCSFTVTITDTENPTITCPGNVNTTVDAGNCSAVVNGIAPVATNDNCGVTIQTWALTGATTANSAATGINDASGQTFNVGATTVTYTLTDAANNTITCSFTVTVSDDEDPTITCPANVSQVNDAGNCSAVVNGIAPVATNDNCGVTVQTWTLSGATVANSAATGINDASGQTFNVGVTTVTYFVEDAASNSATCSFTVTVTDAEAPTITCPANVTQVNDAGNCSAVVTGIAPTATNDNCGVTIQTWALTGATTANSAATGINDASGQTFNVGVTTVTYTLTDAASNTITCSFTVTITDTENPTITCPGNVNTTVDAGNCSAVVNGIAPVATNDNCGVTIQTWALTGATTANSAATGINDASGQTFNVGATTVTYTLTDAANNTITCSFTVTVSDDEDPTITCPANVSQVNDAGNCSAVVNGIAPVATNDNCGVTVQTWTLSGATVANSAATGINDASGQTFNVGVTTVTYFVEDAASNSATCSFTVTVTDAEAPTITCPANVIQVNDAGNCSAVVTGIAPTATNDNCGVTIQTWALTGATTANSAATGINDASGQTFNVGVTTVTYTLTDAASNTITCSFTVTITDTENPTITCPGNVNTTVDAGNCSAVVNGIAPVATNDNCGVTIQTWALTGATTANSAATGINDASGQTFNVGATTVTYTLTDAANNTITCSFTVTVSDDEDPTITCPANVSQVNDAGNCSAVVNGIAPVATNDNCGVTVQTWTLSGATVANSAATGINDASGQTFNVGVTTVTYFVEDAASNSATCSFTVTVTDAEAPTITCPANVIQVNDAGNCSAVVTGIAPTATNDNCGVTIQTWALTGATTANSAATGINDASGQTFNVGVTTVTYTLTDAASNTIACSFAVTITDTENPTITCPANVTQVNDAGNCSAVVNGIAPTATNDNCAITDQTWTLTGATTASSAATGINDASGQTFNVGVTTVTYLVTDAATNSATCSFTVTITDTENPTITCPGNVNTTVDAGNCSAVVNGIAPVATNDNCGVTIQTWALTGATTANSAATGINDASGQTFNVGVTTVTYTLTDAANNTITCSFTVTVSDDEDPTITCPANVSQVNDAGNCSAVVNGIAPVATNDNCGVTVQTWTLSGATVANSAATGINDASGQTFNVGVTTVTYFVEDAASNSATCSFTVTVTDAEAPTITCPANVTQVNDAGNCSAVVTGIAPTATNDNCGVTIQTWALTGVTTANSAATGINDASGQTFNVGVTTVTYTLTDAASNTITCSFTVTITDTENPTITCPGNVNTTVDAGNCSAVVNGIAPVATNDNCGVTIQTWALTGATTASSAATGINDASGQTFNVGVTTVTYVVADAVGNSATCNFTVTVNDTENPTITCPGNVVQGSDLGNCSAVVNGIAPTAINDNCGVTIQTWALTGATVANSAATGINDASGQVFNVGVTTVTYVVTDAAGNSTTCNFTVTVNDTENPTVICPANKTQANDLGNCSAVVNGIAPIAINDNCGVTIQTWALTGATTANSAATGINDASGQTFNVGVTTVTYTLTDAAGNSNSCSFTVTVNDTENPTITCPGNVVQGSDLGNCSAVVNGIAPTATNDNCGVTIQTWALTGATTASSAATGINDASGQTFNVGVTTVTYVVADAVGNSATCNFTVTVNDTENPTITCPGNVVQGSDLGNCSAVVNGIAPTAINDNCGVTIQTWALTGATVANSAATGINDASGQVFNVGVTTVTYVVTDAAGNSTTCNFTVTVNDTENPTVICPANKTQANDLGNCSAVVIGIAPIAINDNCGVTIQTWALTGATTANSAATGINDASGQTFNVGVTTVTYTLTDAAGNSNSCSFTVTVNDTENPTITCPGNVVQGSDLGNCSAVVNGIAPTATNDNCGVTIQTWALTGATTASSAATGINDASGQTFNVGVTTVTYIVTDATGNTAICNFTVTVNDTENPTITCPGNVIQVNDLGNCSAVINGIAPSIINDNCGVVSQTWALTGATLANSPATGINNASGQVFNVGVTNVTYTVTDAAGNSTSCGFVVSIFDTELPTITCPANVVQANDLGNCSAVVNGIAPTTSDNCAVTIQTWALAGATTGNSAATGINDASGQTFNQGITTVTYVITDAAGNSATCNFTVTINDTENPTITCPLDLVQGSDAANCSAVVTGIAPLATNDNCGVTTQTWALTGATTANSPAAGINDASGQTFNVGVTTVTYTLLDAAGNTITCSFTVTINDTENPTISCPLDVVQANDLGNCSAAVNGIAPVSINDNCGVTIQTWALTGATTANSAATGINDASGQTFNVGVTTVTYTVTDAAGNTATCNFTVTINDTENPVITCPLDVIQANDLGNCSAIVNGIAPASISDNCGVTIQTWALTGATTASSAVTGINDASGQTFNQGVTTVTYVITDAAGNTATCNFTVTINDTENPTITCPLDVVQANDLGNCSAVVNGIAPVATNDNCGVVTQTWALTGATTANSAPVGINDASGQTFNVGVTTVTYTLLDAAGNTITCSFTVTINDTENPTISCPLDVVQANDLGNCSAVVNGIAPASINDNCGVTVQTWALTGATTANSAATGINDASGQTFNVGVTTVTYTIIDAAGNSVTCSFTVTINDTENPTIVCPGNISQNNDLGLCGALVNYATPVGADNCPGSITSLIVGLPSGSVFPIGTTTVTYEVIDLAGNTAQCSFDVIITDNELPVVTCPLDQNDFYDASCQYTVLDYVPTTFATDNCGILSVTQSPVAGTIISANQLVTMTVTDVNGNISTCTFNIFLADSTSPSITCPGNQNVFFNASCQYSLLNYTGMAVGSDNCGTVTYTQSPAPGTIILTTQTVTITANDGNGNTSTCSFDVIPVDNIPPTLICPPNTNVSLDANCQFTLLDYTTAAFTTDNCGPITLTQSPAAGTIILGPTAVTITAVDGAGNMTSCVFNVIPADNTGPIVTCPGNQNVFFDAACSYTLLDYTGMAVATDNCGIASITQSPVAGTAISNTTTITITVTDLSGNVSTCSFDVVPTDNIFPTITCPADQTVSLSSTCDYSLINFGPLVVANDNCAVTSLIQSPAIGTIITTTQTLTFTAIDGAGNSVNCSFDVIPEDVTPPTLTCPPTQNVSFTASCDFVLPDYTTSSVSSDNCGVPVLTQVPAPGTIITATQNVVITSTDGSGNFTTCNFNVIPADNTPPLITSCPPNQNEYVGNSCKYTLPDYTGLLGAIDNCGTITVTQSPGVGVDISNTTTITLTADDGNGNSSTCSFDIFLADTISPTISCPPSALNVFFDVNCEYILQDYSGLGSAFDNCGTTIISQSPAIGTAILANQVLTLIVTDASGNTGQCDFDIIPQDTIAPNISCPGTQVEYLDNTCNAIIGDYTGLANTTANCEAVIVTQSPLPGTVFNSPTTVLLFGEDASGNISFCSFNVTVQDTISPQIICPADINSCDNKVIFTPPTATDNCGTATVTRITGLPSGSTFPDGITLMTYVATDASGNTDTCTFIINVFVKPQGVAVPTDISCYGEVDGSIDLTVSLGAPPYSYQWSNSVTTEDVTGLAQGTYQVVITDSNGCVDTVDAAILEPDSLWIESVVENISCYGEVDGAVYVTVNGGTFPYSYAWSPVGSGNAATGLPEGTYTLTITDGRGCVETESYAIVEPDSISLTADISQYSNGWQISVENGSDGYIDLTVSGGTGPFDYDWDNGEVTPFISDLIAGTYTVIVTDDMGCEYEESYILDQPLAVVMSNAFSPNGDGMNDVFFIKNIDRYPENTLTVMNRWGDVVYEKAGYANDWDGTPNKGIVLYGNQVPEGSYFYILNLGDDQGKLTGYIVINR